MASFKCGVLDWASLQCLAAHYLTQPIDGVVLAVTTGEDGTLDPSEVSSMADIVSEIFDGAVPIYLGVSGSDT